MAARDVLIGTYTRGREAGGIYRCRWDAARATLTGLELAAPADNPSFLIRSGDDVLAVEEVDDYGGEPQGAVSRFRMRDGAWERTARQPTLGADPCHLATDGRRLAVANYNGANVALLEMRRGMLEPPARPLAFSDTGPHPRQQAPHPHGVYFLGEALWITDLGGDRIHRVALPSLASLAPIPVTPGAGPRHLARAASGTVYVLNELASTIEVIRDGASVQSVTTLADDASAPGGAAELALTADGAHLLASDRGSSSLAAFAVDPDTGLLGAPRFADAGGRHPRHFAIVDDAWLLVANRDTDSLAALPLADGSIGAVAASLDCPAPVCVLPL